MFVPASRESLQMSGQPRDALLTMVRYLTPSTRLYEFRPVDGLPLDPPGPGSHVDLHFPDGAVRQYSVTSLRRDVCQIAVQRDANGRGASRYLHEKARVGDRFRLGAFRNLFPLASDSSHSVFIAGGIGITPLLPMMDELQSRSRSWELHYASRDEVPAFHEELRGYGERVHHWRGSAPGPLQMDIAGLVQKAPRGSTFYCCGPERMIAAFVQATAGLPEGQARFERFHAAPAVAAGAGSFTVELHRQQRTVEVPRDRSILDCLAEAGIAVTSSCLQGICGVCETRVLAGRPDHRDDILTPAERATNATMMICCSGSLEDKLVLDL